MFLYKREKHENKDREEEEGVEGGRGKKETFSICKEVKHTPERAVCLS